jgi:hypothetical protein
MLQRTAYRRQWQAKLAWYKNHGVPPLGEGGRPTGVLITTARR